MDGLLKVFRFSMLFLIIRALEAVPSFVVEPLSPQNVTEGDNATFSWNYNIDEPHQQIQLRKIGAKSQAVIVDKLPNKKPTITTKYKDRFHVQFISDNQSSVIITGIRRSDSGEYEYAITDKNFKVGTSIVEISVLYKPNINSFITGNLTVNERDTPNLVCIADGNPEPSIAWIRLSDERPVHSPLTITGKQDEGKYRCVASNGVGNPDIKNVYIFVENHHPMETIVTTDRSDNTVVVNTTFVVACSATARPPAKYRFFRGTEFVTDTDSDGEITTSVNERVKNVKYSCVPYNFYGNGSTGVVTVKIQYPAMITDPENVTLNVTLGEKVDIFCNGTGNPKPIIRLVAIFGDGSNGSVGESLKAKPDGPVRFLCTAENALAKKVKWIHLVLNTMEFNITLSVINKDCSDDLDEVIKQLRELVIEILKKRNVPIANMTPITHNCGSVAYTVYISMKFSQNVAIENVLTLLKNASAEERGFGNLKVDPESIQVISPERIPTTLTPALTPTPVDVTEGHPSGTVVTIVAVVVISVILMLIGCSLYKKRPWKKDHKEVFNSRSQERPCPPPNDSVSLEMDNLNHYQGEEDAASGAVVGKGRRKPERGTIKQRNGTRLKISSL